MHVVEYAREVTRQYDKLDRPMVGRFIYLTDQQLEELLQYWPLQITDAKLYSMEVRRYGARSQ